MEFLDFFASSITLWIGAIIIFLLIEAATMGLTTIWFAGGAVAGLIVAILGGSIILQVIVFLLVTIVLLCGTRKLLVEKLKTGSERTNIEALIGKKAMVTSEIKPFSPGMAVVAGQTWTCASKNEGVIIPSGTEVIIVGIEGVKVIVEPAE